MKWTLWILVASAITFVTKYLGYLVPARWLETEQARRYCHTVTIGLLTALVVTNCCASGQVLTADCRLLALGAAAIGLWLKLPFIVVVILGALAAGLGRAFGLA